ncbi:MAG: hypothetical protein ABJM29_17390 [Rhizobiaceae bacterium]
MATVQPPPPPELDGVTDSSGDVGSQTDGKGPPSMGQEDVSDEPESPPMNTPEVVNCSSNPGHVICGGGSPADPGNDPPPLQQPDPAPGSGAPPPSDDTDLVDGSPGSGDEHDGEMAGGDTSGDTNPGGSNCVKSQQPTDCLPPESNDPPGHQPPANDPPFVHWPPHDGGHAIVPRPGPKRIVRTRPTRSKVRKVSRIAVIIGVPRYGYKRLPYVSYTTKNMDYMRQMLKTRFGLTNNRILYVKNPRKAKMKQIFNPRSRSRDALASLLRRYRPDEVIIYYVGGATVINSGRLPLLLPADAHPKKLASSGYPLASIYSSLRKMGVRRLQFYIEAAFSKVLGRQRSSVGADLPKHNLQPGHLLGDSRLFDNWSVFVASSNNRPVIDDGEVWPAIFTMSIVNGMRGSADRRGYGNRDGFISAAELIRYSRQVVKDHATDAAADPLLPQQYGRGGRLLHRYRAK